LKRGYTKDKTLWEWRKTTLDGQTERRDGAIILQDEARQEVMRWTFREGWISKYEGASLNSTSNEVAIESIEIAHEGLEFE
jgi:phage tail-like protein